MFKVGDKVVCVAGDYAYVKINEELVVEAVDGNRIKFPGLYSRYTPANFKLVEQAQQWNRDEWVPQVGEEVYITGRDEYAANGMEQFVNNEVVYLIEDIRDGVIDLKNHDWVYKDNGEALTPVAATNGKAIAALAQLV